MKPTLARLLLVRRAVEATLEAVDATASEGASILASVLCDVFVMARPMNDAQVVAEMRRMAARLTYLADLSAEAMQAAAVALADSETH